MSHLHIRIITGSHEPPPGSVGIVHTALSDELFGDGRGIDPIPDGDALLLILGGARGVDTMAREWTRLPAVVKRGGVFFRELPALWDLCRYLGSVNAAGPVRNEEMVQCALVYARELGVAIASMKCLAFPSAKSRGTWDCHRRCERNDIETRVVRLGVA